MSDTTRAQSAQPSTPKKELTIEQRRAQAEDKLAALKAEAEVRRLENQIKLMDDAANGKLPQPVQLISEHILRIQEDQNAIRMGQITDSQASNVLKGHNLILRAAEANLAYQRLHKGRFPQDQEMRYIGRGTASQSQAQNESEPEQTPAS